MFVTVKYMLLLYHDTIDMLTQQLHVGSSSATQCLPHCVICMEFSGHWRCPMKIHASDCFILSIETYMFRGII